MKSHVKTFKYYKELYLEKLQNKGYSSDTLESYGYSLNRFYKYLLKENLEDIREIGKDEINKYIKSLYEEGRYDGKALSSGSIESLLKVTRQFFSFLEEEELIFKNPVTREKKRGMTAVHLKESLTIDEIKRLFKTPDLLKPNGFRDRVILEVLYCTGIRKSELVNLNLNDIDFSGNILYVKQGKGKKDRIVPLTKSSLMWVKRYINRVRIVFLKKDSLEQALFVTRLGLRFSRNTVARIIRGYAKKCRINRSVSTHILRHTFASHMIKGGAGIRYVQEILGHEKLSTTRIYTKVYVEDMKKAIKMYHPLENDLYDPEVIDLPSRKTEAGKVMLPRVYTAKGSFIRERK